MKLIQNFILLTAIGAAGLCLAAPRPDDDSDVQDLGPKLATSRLVRVADLASDPLTLLPLPLGNDPIDRGSVEVRTKRMVVVQMEGVPSSQDFDVQFCRFSSAPDRCQSIGAVHSDANGQVREVLQFPGSGNTWAGQFAVRRNNATQYVSGFTLASPAPASGAEVSVKGRVKLVDQQAGTFSLDGFQPVILVDSETKFKGRLSLSDLKAGMDVEVEGVTRPDGSVLASDVKAKVQGKEKD